MISSRRPPTFIPSTPWSQPGITSPAPSVKVNGSSRLQEESNSSSGLVADADVLDGDFVAGFGFGAVAFYDFHVFQLLRRRPVGHRHLRLGLRFVLALRTGGGSARFAARLRSSEWSTSLLPQPATASASATHSANDQQPSPAHGGHPTQPPRKLRLAAQPLPEIGPRRAAGARAWPPARSAGLTESEPGLASGAGSSAASAASIFSTTPRS